MRAAVAGPLVFLLLQSLLQSLSDLRMAAVMHIADHKLVIAQRLALAAAALFSAQLSCGLVTNTAPVPTTMQQVSSKKCSNLGDTAGTVWHA
jgi:hypothetical protein